MKNPKTLRGKYKKLVSLSQQYRELRNDFGRQMEERFGFDHSDTDDSQMIDAIEYGSGSLPFEEFIERAEYYERQYAATGSFQHPFDSK